MSWIPTQSRYLSLPFSGVPIATAGGAQDAMTLAIPADVQWWAPDKITVRASMAAGTLAAATFDARTLGGGGGTSLFSAPIALTSITTANGVQVLSAISTVALSATGVTLRQTVNSLNLGTGVFTLHYYNLT